LDVSKIVLSLVSHTNVGKTTLARTLLGSDVGVVRDAPHVTELAQSYTLLALDGGESLVLWDTPGFGDSVRLVKRLKRHDNPLGWFLREVWDRWTDRALWSSQHALRNVRDEADVLLYLVNASESPEAAGYIDPEIELLGWTAKPVVMLLNQLGPPRDAATEAAELERWRRFAAAYPQVKAVLPLDAFARCWVQEVALLSAIEDMLEGAPRSLMARLRAAWQRRREATFDASMNSIAGSLARLAVDREAIVRTPGWGERLRQIGGLAGLSGSSRASVALGEAALAGRLDTEVRTNTAELIELHGLEGRAQGEILVRLATHFERHVRLDEGKAALWGSVASGALLGLKADLLSGGLTLGGGMLAGGIIGALGAAGLARCVNLIRGTDQPWVAWNTASLHQLVQSSLLRYLAVAHFGRGRGDWAGGESPAHWQQVVERALEPCRAALDDVWRRRELAREPADARALATELGPILGQAARAALRTLYPHWAGPPLPERGVVRENAQPAAPASQ
jgi:hypothetical protein